jgi:4-amino-4-deoxy-L-arabinose transferase-like glycosyltransferase
VRVFRLRLLLEMFAVAAPAAEARERRLFGLLMLVAFVVIGAGIGLRDPWPSDEPRFTLAAKQMVDSGEWLFPHRGVELYSDKPPMLMWLEAASYELTRHWRVAFLLPSLLASLATIALTYDLGRRLWDRRAGLFAAGALLATFQFVYQAKRAQIDPLIVCWLTLANWGLLIHFVRGPDWRAYWIGCFAAGLGVITKGVGVLAALMFVPYVFAVWRGWPGVTRAAAPLRWLGGAVAFAAAAALWLAPMLTAALARGTPEYAAYVQDVLFHQTAGRFLNSWDHPHSFLFYVPIVLFSWFPLSLTYAGTIPRWRDALRARDARVLLPLAWCALVIVFFCIPKGKRDVYIMPVLPMLALASGPYLEALTAARSFRAAACAIACVGGAILLVAGIGGYAGSALIGQVVQRDLPDAGDAAWGIAIAIGAAMLAAAAIFRVRRGVHALLAGLAAMWLVWSFWAYPVFNGPSSAAEVMRRAGAAIGPDAELGMVAWKEQNMLLADRPALDFGFTRPWPEQFAAATRWQARAPDHRWLFALEDAMGACVDKAGAIDVGRANRREWWVFRADVVVPGCVPAGGTDADTP